MRITPHLVCQSFKQTPKSVSAQRVLENSLSYYSASF